MKIFLFLSCVLSLNLLACVEPYKPTCINYGGEFDSKIDFEFCKTDVQRYLDDEVDEYIKCVLEEQNEEKLEAIKKFNCRANGDTFCY